MSLRPFIEHKEGHIEIDYSSLLEKAQQITEITSDADSGNGTIAVKSIEGFAINQLLFIGEIGGEQSEIIKTDNVTAPSGTTITLDSNLVQNHPKGTKVYLIAYDQIELSHAATAAGSKSVLATVDIAADMQINVYQESTQTSGVYFARYKETIGNTFGDYTDPAAHGGYAENTVGEIIKYALAVNNYDRFKGRVTREFCLREINDCLRKVQGEQLRWPEHQNLNAILGQTSRGNFEIDMPSDIYDDTSNKSLIDLRIGTGVKLQYLDPIEFEQMLENVALTQVRTQAVATDTSLDVDNSYDYEDSGSVNVYVNNTKYNVTYTGVTRDDATGATGAFTGVPASGTGAITVTIAVDTNVWQGETEGEPLYWTVRNGKIYIWPLPDAAFDNMNVYGDYWKVATKVDSMADVIENERYDMVYYWLCWKIRMQKKNEGQLDMADGFYKEFDERLNKGIRHKGRGVQRKMNPVVPRYRYNRRYRKYNPNDLD